MPNPSSSLATLRPDIAQSLEQFEAEASWQGFVALEVMPPFDVPTQAGNFGIIPIEEMLQDSADVNRAPGAGYNRSAFKFKPSTYTCLEHGAEESIDDRERNMYANYFDAERISAIRARDKVKRNLEKRIATILQDATTYSAQTTNVSTAWSTTATSTPLDDVKNAKLSVFGRTGAWPNAVVMNRKVFENLRLTAQIRDVVKYVDRQLPGDIDMAELAAAFGVDKVIVAGAPKNTANSGQSASIDWVWSSSYVSVVRIPVTEDFREPCFGRTFHWGVDGSSIGGTIETYRDETVRGDVVRVRMDTDEHVLYSDTLQILGNIT